MLPAGGTVQLSTVLVGAGTGHVQGHANDLWFCVVTATVSGQRERGEWLSAQSVAQTGKYLLLLFDLPPVGFNARLSHREGRHLKQEL